MKSFLLLSKLGFFVVGEEISYRYNHTATSVKQASLDNTNDLKPIFDEKHQNSISDKKPNILLILADDVGTGQWYLVLASPITNNSSSNMVVLTHSSFFLQILLFRDRRCTWLLVKQYRKYGKFEFAPRERSYFHGCT